MLCCYVHVIMNNNDNIIIIASFVAIITVLSLFPLFSGSQDKI